MWLQPISYYLLAFVGKPKIKWIKRLASVRLKKKCLITVLHIIFWSLFLESQIIGLIYNYQGEIINLPIYHLFNIFCSFFTVVLPHDPYVFIGHELRLYCNITDLAVPETSTSLYFTKSNNVFPSSRIQILNSRSIQLILPIYSPSDKGNYVCKLNKTRGNVQVVGNQIVSVECTYLSILK